MRVPIRLHACLPSCACLAHALYDVKLLIPCQHSFPRSALISFPDARMGPRQRPHATLSSGHLVEGLTNPPPTRGSHRPRRLQPRILVDLVFKLPQGGTLLLACFIDGRPLLMNQVLGPLVLLVAHLPILQDVCNLIAELDSDHKRVPLCLHSVQTRIMMIRLQEAYMECQVKLQSLK